MSVTFREVTPDDLDPKKDPALAVLNDMLRQMALSINNIEATAVTTARTLTSNSVPAPIVTIINAGTSSVSVGPGVIGFDNNTNQAIKNTVFTVTRPAAGTYTYYFSWNPTTLNVEVDGPYTANTAANKIPSNTGRYLIATAAVV